MLVVVPLSQALHHRSLVYQNPGREVYKDVHKDTGEHHVRKRPTEELHGVSASRGAPLQRGVLGLIQYLRLWMQHKLRTRRDKGWQHHMVS